MPIMKDSILDDTWLTEVMTKNPPCIRPNGEIFTGPVRLAFVNLLEPDKKGKYNCALLFPVGTDMSPIQNAALEIAREKFPRDFDDQGPIGIHFPFHDQKEKAFGDSPYKGYTPGGVFFNVSNNETQPDIFDTHKQKVTDPSKVYSGVWAFLLLNTYTYGPPQPKKGVSFGIRAIMLAQDDQKLGGGGGQRNAEADFGFVKITATANVADKFGGTQAARSVGLMPAGGHVGRPGNVPSYSLPTETEAERIMREMME